MRRWLPLLIALMQAVWLSSSALAATGTCSKLMRDLDAKKLKGEIVKVTQQRLVQLGYHPDGIDGVLGPRTRLSLALFCADAQFAVSSDMLETVHNHDEIARAYPDWRQTLVSRDFLLWLGAQADAVDLRRMRDFGNSAQVIALLQRFAARPRGGAQPQGVDASAISYSLTAADYQQLATRAAVLAKFAKLLNASYPAKEDFEDAAAAVLKGVPDYRYYIELAEAYGSEQTGYRISAAAFKSLALAGVPPYVLEVLHDIQDTSFPDDELDEIVQTALDKLVARTTAFQPELVKLAELTPSGASLTEASLAKFAEAGKDDALIAAILPRLEKVKGVKYKNDKALGWAMKVLLAAVGEEIDASGATVLEHAEEASGYGFGKIAVQQVRAQLDNKVVPGPCLEIIASIAGADYPDPELFSQAVHAKLKLAGSSNLYRLAIFSAIDKPGVLKVSASGKVVFDESLLAAFKEQKVPEVVVEGLARLQGKSYPGVVEFRDAINKQIAVIGAELIDKYGEFIAPLTAQARKAHPYKADKVIEWDGQGCDCVNDHLAGRTYGFLPYWLAGGKQYVDFNVLSRIGYYDVAFDDEGRVLQPERWSKADSGFIRQARRYGSKVDLVVYRNEWGNWGGLSAVRKLEAFEKLAVQIDELVRIPLDDFASRAESIISLGTMPRPVRGDGVTLYFDGYPGDPGSVDAFKAFIRKLQEKLGKDDRRFSVNLMFRSSNIGSGIYDYARLLDFMRGLRGGENEMDGMLLVLLEEPSTTDKKKLRKLIEDGLHGRDRVKLLRDVVMVVSYDGVSRTQLTDDVIYASDNFAGIGFWPLAMTVKGMANEGDIAATMHANYIHADALDLGECRYICPNRWLFRLAWALAVLLLLASALAYAVKCSWRSWFERYFIRFMLFLVVPFVLLSFSLLFCDPAWKAVSRDNFLPILMVVAVIAYAIWSYLAKLRRIDLP